MENGHRASCHSAIEELSVSWQVRTALGILRRAMAQYGNRCAACYPASWLVFHLEYCVYRKDDVDLISRDLRKRWLVTSFGDYRRMMEDLDTFWAGFVISLKT